jgi:hypothetical protein
MGSWKSHALYCISGIGYGYIQRVRCRRTWAAEDEEALYLAGDDRQTDSVAVAGLAATGDDQFSRWRVWKVAADPRVACRAPVRSRRKDGEGKKIGKSFVCVWGGD